MQNQGKQPTRHTVITNNRPTYNSSSHNVSYYLEYISKKPALLPLAAFCATALHCIVVIHFDFCDF